MSLVFTQSNMPYNSTIPIFTEIMNTIKIIVCIHQKKTSFFIQTPSPHTFV